MSDILTSWGLTTTAGRKEVDALEQAVGRAANRIDAKMGIVSRQVGGSLKALFGGSVVLGTIRAVSGAIDAWADSSVDGRRQLDALTTSFTNFKASIGRDIASGGLLGDLKSGVEYLSRAREIVADLYGNVAKAATSPTKSVLAPIVSQFAVSPLSVGVEAAKGFAIAGPIGAAGKVAGIGLGAESSENVRIRQVIEEAEARKAANFSAYLAKNKNDERLFGISAARAAGRSTLASLLQISLDSDRQIDELEKADVGNAAHDTLKSTLLSRRDRLLRETAQSALNDLAGRAADASGQATSSRTMAGGGAYFARAVFGAPGPMTLDSKVGEISGRMREIQELLSQLLQNNKVGVPASYAP